MRKRYFGMCDVCSFGADLRIKNSGGGSYSYFCWGCFQRIQIKPIKLEGGE